MCWRQDQKTPLFRCIRSLCAHLVFQVTPEGLKCERLLALPLHHHVLAVAHLQVTSPQKPSADLASHGSRSVVPETALLLLKRRNVGLSSGLEKHRSSSGVGLPAALLSLCEHSLFLTGTWYLYEENIHEALKRISCE